MSLTLFLLVDFVPSLYSLILYCQYGFDKFAIAGGVASNSHLREALEQACSENKIEFYYPSPVYCTDNAAMISCAGYLNYISGIRGELDLNAVPQLSLG